MAHAVRMPRALTATVVAVCTPVRMAETAADLEALRRRSGVRTILISLGADPQPPITTDDDAITISGVVPRYLNNAVASLRLSSLPSLAWWRGDDAALLPELAELVDRLVLDSEGVHDVWPLIPRLSELTLVSDLRWTRLTRWRSLMAQLFDIPEVSQASVSFSRLRIAGSDPYTAGLFECWLAARLGGRHFAGEITRGTAGEALESVLLSGEAGRLSLQLLPQNPCIATAVEIGGHRLAARVVPRGDQSNEALLGEELRIRARDTAFEDAVRLVGTRS